VYGDVDAVCPALPIDGSVGVPLAPGIEEAAPLTSAVYRLAAPAAVDAVDASELFMAPVATPAAGLNAGAVPPGAWP
jgi:hypothetical protein